MEIIKIDASRRNDKGKSEARRLRNAGKIPAVAYGKDLAAQSLAIAPSALTKVLNSVHGRNTVVELDVDGQSKVTALVRDYQYHPVSREFLHADFIQISLDQEVDVEVALELTGKAQGVVLGGTLRQVFRSVPVRCLPEKIPVKLVHDITALGLDGHVAAKDLVLPEGVKVRLAPERTLVSIVKEKIEREEEVAKPGAAPAAAPAAAGKAEPEKKAEKK
ncbi:MAG TPA: 50S ribosomal protein L25 [Polyangiaceae bacterium]|nr:50S ribosomal protein L25 [Polyangiaceae bacterium]